VGVSMPPHDRQQSALPTPPKIFFLRFILPSVVFVWRLFPGFKVAILKKPKKEKHLRFSKEIKIDLLIKYVLCLVFENFI